METLEPCPFCGSFDCAVPPKMNYVRCFSCFAVGPAVRASGKEGNGRRAMSAWDTRADFVFVRHYGKVSEFRGVS